MTDSLTPLPSRRAQREARLAGERARMSSVAEPTDTVAHPTGELPSRRSLRHSSPETVAEPQPVSGAVTENAVRALMESAGLGATHDSARSAEPHSVASRHIIGDQTSPIHIPDAGWRGELTLETDELFVPSTRGMGTVQAPATSIHVAEYPTGEISGPIGSTNEIILTGPITVVSDHIERLPTGPISASIDDSEPGVPRRATEALSIIGTQNHVGLRKSTMSKGQSIAAGLAAFLGLVVIGLVVFAFVTNIL